jgi:hypothetical protein
MNSVNLRMRNKHFCLYGYFNYLPCFEKKIGLCDHFAACTYISSINFWMAEPIFMKLDAYIMHLSPTQLHNL